MAKITNRAAGKIGHFGFCKRIVDNLENQAEFYRNAFELVETLRYQSEHSLITGGPISEVNFAPTVDNGATLVLLELRDRAAPPPGEMVVGFMTSDLEALVARVVAGGGRLAGPIGSVPEEQMRVAFVEDPEGRLIQVAEIA